MIAPDFVLSEMHKRALDGYGNPLGKSPLKKDKIMTAETCAHMIMKSVENRDRLLLTSLRGRLLYMIQRFLPSIVDGITAKAIKEAR